MVSEVPRGQTRIVVQKHFFDGSFRFNRTVRARDLPESIEDTRAGEIFGEGGLRNTHHIHLYPFRVHCKITDPHP